MLERKVSQELDAWKNRKDHKSLIITGQRQIGKTYIIKNSFSKKYKSFIYFNFIEEPELKAVFNGNLDVETLKFTITLSTNGKFIDNDTLILFDEIQECPNALGSLKFWTEDGRYDVIGMGSSLGMNFSSNVSYPVGKVEYINMYSLDFEEFLWALGVNKDSIVMLNQYFETKTALPDAVLSSMSAYLRQYMAVGGMPDVVNEYVANKDLHAVHKIQRRLINDYRMDIARFAAAEARIKAQKCYDSIMTQLSKENHKFQYSQIESKATATKFGSSIEWLKEQLLIVEIQNLKRIEYPLEAYADDTNFRIYPTDIGMLIGKYDESLKKAILEDGILENAGNGIALGTAKGGLYEALAADMLYKRGYKDKMFFYKNEKSTSELEFVLYKNDTIIPLEIKAGKKKANSLNNILNDNYQIPFGYKFSSKNVGISGKLVTFPLFMLMFF